MVPPPNPGSTSAGSICVSTPSNGATVNSPVHLVAGASFTGAIDHMRVYVDGQPNYFTYFTTMDALLWMDPGQHNVLILATDRSGNNFSNTFNVNVAGDQTRDFTALQNLPNWEHCSAKFPPGNPRAGQICAAGLGDAVSQMIPNQSAPSLSGSSAKFTMGGPSAYSNMLYYKALGGGRNTTHFVYEMSFYIDNPDVVQALEFDVNQSFDNKRWVFGTECNFRDTHRWDVWDGVKGWQPTSIPCDPFPANTWIHLVWTFERVGDQVHYISLQINDQVHPLDLYFNREYNWTMEDINVAFQMDGDFQQDPFNVWVDNIKLTTF